MFHNTHSIFADIIQAEIFEPILSNAIPTPLHIFACSAHFWQFWHSPETLVHIPCAFLWPCLQLLCSISLALIVSNCFPSSCCIMIHDIASLVPSVCSFQVLSSFFVHPWLQSHRVFKFPVSCMFLHSERRTHTQQWTWTWLVFVLLYLTLPIFISIPVHSMHSAYLRTLLLWTSVSPTFALVLRIISVHFLCSSAFQKPNL